jgi:hypothetical protein
MSQTMVQITFKLAMPLATYEQIAEAAAPAIAAVPGLLWKVWGINSTAGEAGSTYLFTDAASARVFLAGPSIAHLAELPGVSDLKVEQFTILANPTSVTRGPIVKTALSRRLAEQRVAA